MREIKFRVWDKKNNRMEYWDDLLYEMFCSGIDIWNTKQFELMQFTGLYDKNGKEIWEGDIISGNWLIAPAIIEWMNDRGSFGWNIRKKREDGTMGGTFGLCEDFMDTDLPIEVIGNIYENSELREK